jgi:hypothetical protein
MANTLFDAELAKAPAPWNRRPLGRPPTVGARIPADPKLKEESLFIALGGIDLTQQTRYYVRYDEIAGDAARRAKPIPELRTLNPERLSRIDAAVEQSGRSEAALGFLAARAPSRDFAVIVDKTSGAIVDMFIATPW